MDRNDSLRHVIVLYFYADYTFCFCHDLGHWNVKSGYQARPKFHVKRVFFHSRALYVCNVNRVSNSCKIGLKGCDFFWDLFILGLFFIQNLRKRVWFLEIWCTWVVLPSLWCLFKKFVFERSSELYLFRGKFIAYLFRVENKEKFFFRVSNPTAILV